MAIFLVLFLPLELYRNGRAGKHNMVLTLFLLLTRVSAQLGETDAADQVTRETSNGVPGLTGDWMTYIAMSNSFLLLLLVGYTTYHIYSIKKQEADGRGKGGMEMKGMLRKLTNSISRKQHSSPSLKAVPNEDDPVHSHDNLTHPNNVKNDCEVQIHPSANQNLNTITEMRQCPPNPTMRCTCSPPCPCSQRLSCRGSKSISNSDLKTGRNKNSPLPPPPTSPPPSPHPKGLECQNATDSEEEHEYDYIELPIRPAPPQQQPQTKDSQHQLKAKEEVKKDSSHSYYNIQLPTKIENNNQVHTQPFSTQSSKGLKTNTEMEQYSEILPLSSTCPPPHPLSDMRNFQDSQPRSNLEFKNITGAKNDSMLPPIPSNCPPHPHLERLQSQETEGENEYDILDITTVLTPPQQQHQAKERQEEINTKKEANESV